MTEHDPLCHAANFEYHDPECCDCDLISKVRADERERNREADGVAAYLAVEQTLIDLHAKVVALRPASVPTGPPSEDRVIEAQADGWDEAIDAVLRLIDGSGE